MRPTGAVASLSDVTVMYGSRAALSHVSVEFPRGSTGLLGNNGAGKTTLMLALLGLIEVSTGAVEILGCNMRTQSVTARRRLGYVPERDTTLPEMTVLDSVVYCGRLSGLPRLDALARSHEVLSYVGIQDERYRAADTLSTGLRQRLKLAQALVHDPDLLLLDEPTNGLDPSGRDRMLELISNVTQSTNMSVILSSHLLTDVERVCDACVIVDKGQIAAATALGDWNRQLPIVYEVRVKGEVGRYRQALDAAHMRWSSADETLLVELPDNAPQRLFTLARESSVQIRHLRRQVETLDDFFHRITGPRQ